jgi:hypothetical protein
MHTRKDDSIHANPAVFAQHHILALQVILWVEQIVIRGYNTDVWRDVSSFPDNDARAKALKVAPRDLKVMQIVRVKVNGSLV